VFEWCVRDWLFDRFERIATDDRADLTSRWAAAASLDSQWRWKNTKNAVAEARALGAWHVYDVGGDAWTAVEDDPVAIDDESGFFGFVSECIKTIERCYDNVVSGTVTRCAPEYAAVVVEMRSWDGRVVRQQGLTWNLPENIV